MNVKRRNVFACLLAVVGLKAQTTVTKEPEVEDCNTCVAPLPPKKYVADQCPVCGTQAKPYKRAILLRAQEPIGDAEQLTRCRVCSAAFWQDAIR